MVPKIQVALDVAQMETALEIAEQVSSWVDYIEAGTPLIKSAGLGIVRELRDRYPDHQIIADMKSTDVGAFEAELAFDAGADFTVVSGITTKATIQEVIRTSAERERKCLVDLTGVSNIIQRAKEVVTIGAKHVVLHRSIDEEVTSEAQWSKPFCEPIDGLNQLGLIVFVAGGLKIENLGVLCEYPAHALIIGRAITGSSDPSSAAAEIAEWVKVNWRS